MAGALPCRGQGKLDGSLVAPRAQPFGSGAGKELIVVELRKKRMTQARIAQYLQISKATVSRVLARAGLSRLSDLDPVESPRIHYTLASRLKLGFL